MKFIATNNLLHFYYLYALLSFKYFIKWFSKKFGKCEVFIIQILGSK